MSHQRHCFAASINQALLQVSHVSNLCLIHTQCTIAPRSCFAHLSRLTDIINDTLSSWFLSCYMWFMVRKGLS